MRRLVTGSFIAASLLGSAGGASAQLAPDPRVEALVAEVSADRLLGIVERLAGFETRHTLSDTLSDERGIGAARRWMVEELRGYSPRLRVEFDSHHVAAQGRVTEPVIVRNVMAVLPGRSERRIYVSGHYDSVVIGNDPNEPAPGANDDASGTAIAMELARVLAGSGLEFDATLVFIGFAGEEQGLVGATLHAADAADRGLVIDAVFNNDVVGNSRGGDGVRDGTSVRVFSAGPEDSPSRQLARYIRRHAAVYVPGHDVRPISREDRFGRGGDHTPFERQGFASVRLTESREDYSRQHTELDTPDGIDPEYLARNARVNVACVASLALAPPAPAIVDDRGAPMVGRGESRYDTHVRWRAVPGSAGYRIFWRRAWEPDWQHVLEVDAVEAAVLPGISIDDHVFGVAAVGPTGHESLVSAYVMPARPVGEIETVR